MPPRVTAAARHFLKKLNWNVSKTTTVSIKKAYIEGMKEKRAIEGDGDLQVLPTKKCGRQVLLGHVLDMKVQLQVYRKKVREGGGIVSARIAMAAARGIHLICNRSMLAEYGNQFSGRIQLFVV